MKVPKWKVLGAGFLIVIIWLWSHATVSMDPRDSNEFDARREQETSFSGGFRTAALSPQQALRTVDERALQSTSDEAATTMMISMHSSAELLPSLSQEVVDPAKTNSKHRCNEKLYTPTFVTFLEPIRQFAIVDCWHHRVIFSKSLDSPIPQWKDLLEVSGVARSGTGDEGGVSRRFESLGRSLLSLKIPHSIATNGQIVVTESSVGGSNGGNHSVLVFRKTSDGQMLEFLEEVTACSESQARRPHRVIYDEDTSSFFLYLTSPPFLVRFAWNEESQRLERKECLSLPFMKGMYARSLVAVNKSLFITAGPGVITRLALTLHKTKDLREMMSIRPIKSYPIKPLGFVKGKMNDLAFIDGWWYATSTVPCAMVRFRNIDRLWEHERLHQKLGLCSAFSRKQKRCLGGTPYFVSKVGDRIVVPYIFGCSGVVSFRANADSGLIDDVQQHWEGGWVEDEDDLSCRGQEW